MFLGEKVAIVHTPGDQELWFEWSNALCVFTHVVLNLKELKGVSKTTLSFEAYL